MRLLIIDDDATFRKMLRTWLVKEGHDVHESDNCQQALTLLQTFDYDAITLDLRMPDANGPTVLDAIRRSQPDTTVLVISAEADTRVAVELVKQGAAACFEKPVNFRDLQGVLGRLAS